jgi:hypothetical protein
MCNAACSLDQLEFTSDKGSYLFDYLLIPGHAQKYFSGESSDSVFIPEFLTVF